MPSWLRQTTAIRQRFDIPAVCAYLDAASHTPRPRAVAAAGRRSINRSRHPWLSGRADVAPLVRQARELSAQIIQARAGDMALVNSVAYGMATAAANLSLHRHQRVLLLEDEHPSTSLIWRHEAEKAGATVATVPRPADGDWTSAVMARLEAAEPIGIAVLSPVHWTDGGVLDLAPIASGLRRQGAALVLDATQAAGVMDIDAPALDADFVMFPAYKWLLGPYGLDFLYAHPRHQSGVTLEHHMGTRKAPTLQRAGPAGDFSHAAGAVRFDRGERDDDVLLTMAVGGLKLATELSPAQKREILWPLNDHLAHALAGFPVHAAERRFRAPHIYSIDLRGVDAVDVTASLARRSVHVCARRGYLRVSPYLYNTDSDIAAFANALREALAAARPLPSAAQAPTSP